ncbi:hypothetical protein SAMN06265364_1196 [Prevotella jejuni]|uniref:Uncharacterized protein n=1 Tax=Prevotella jejuni TaxID=1177574 RepID=A0AA94LL37_9BACT|nr:hypothetical protein SAMN06265364_1196 [Prevotella jejuni]
MKAQKSCAPDIFLQCTLKSPCVIFRQASSASEQTLY